MKKMKTKTVEIVLWSCFTTLLIFMIGYQIGKDIALIH